MADRKKSHSHNDYVPPSMDETKEHVLAAGREILLAAQGALRFCKTYAEATSCDKNRPNIVSFFQKAISVADELGKSILQVSPVGSATKDISKSVMDFVEKEMAEKPVSKAKTKRASVKKKKTKRKSTK